MRVEIPFEESINLHGSRIANEKKEKKIRTRSKLEMCLNILLVVLCIVVALMCISIAMVGFSFCTMRIAQMLV